MRPRRLRRAVALIVLAATALVVAACGDDGPRVGTVDGEVRDPEPGGALTYLAAERFDSLDPGRTYRSLGFMAAFAVGRPLYSAPAGDDGPLVPDLARDAPSISDDRRTVTVHLRSDVRYAPPVGRAVTSADVKYAVERAFSRNVANPYAGRYFSSLVGAPEPGRGAIRSIAGILTPDETTVVFQLTRPDANLVVQALALPITIPVPREYAAPLDATVPSTYGERPAASGPYMFERTSPTARVRTDAPVVLVRNPNWSADDDIRPAYLESITIRSGQANRAHAIDVAATGERTVCCGATRLPAPLVRRLVADHPALVDLVPDGSTRTIALNTAAPPFDDVNLRRAVAAALDRQELRRAAGGDSVGQIASGWIPPGIPGYAAAGADHQNPTHDELANPAGDLAVARRYMDAAQADGLPVREGTWMGTEPIVVVASTDDADRPIATIVRQQLESLGFTVRVRHVSRQENSRRQCGAAKSPVAVCLMTWTPDLIDPQAVLDPQFNAAAIRPTDGTNWSRLDDSEITDALDEAAQRPMGEEREAAYVAITEEIAERMPSIPWLWGQTAIVHSSDTVSVVNRMTGLTDLSLTWVVGAPGTVTTGDGGAP